MCDSDYASPVEQVQQRERGTNQCLCESHAVTYASATALSSQLSISGRSFEKSGMPRALRDSQVPVRG